MRLKDKLCGSESTTQKCVFNNIATLSQLIDRLETGLNRVSSEAIEEYNWLEPSFSIPNVPCLSSFPSRCASQKEQDTFVLR